MKNWVEVSGRRLAANYGVLARAAGAGVAVLAVVKANAYGHGVEVCAPVLAGAGAEWLGVTDAAEGIAVREALLAAGLERGRQPRVLVMSGLLGEDADAIVRHGLTPVAWTREQMEWLADAAARAGVGRVDVHLEIDTGMARQGVAVGDDLYELLHWLKGQPSLRLDGVMTHFASSEVAESLQTFEQLERFEGAIEAVKAAGLRPAWVHAGNSSTLDNQGTDKRDSEENLEWLHAFASALSAKAMVRAGIGLYGYCPPIEFVGSSKSDARVRGELRPVMTWKTRVTGVREVKAGDTVGYNATFVAERPMRLALLPVGYADGLRRELSSANGRSGGWVMIEGRRAAIVGRVSMNLTVVDVTDIPGVRVGDEVVLLGDGVTADEHARQAGTISYEIVCGVRAESQLVDAGL